MDSRISCSLLFVAGLLGLYSVTIRKVVAEESGSDPRTIRVRTVDSSEAPISGVSILLNVSTEQKGFPWTQNLVTDSDGLAKASLPRTMRSVRLWIRKDGFARLYTSWYKDKIASVPGEVEFVLPRGTTIGGVVVNEAGEPLVGAAVEVRCDGGGKPMNPGLSISYAGTLASGDRAVLTDDQGRWRYSGVPPGDDVELSLKFSHSAHIPDEHWGELQAIHGVTTRQLREQSARIVMNRGHVLRGRVLDGDGRPISGALLTWSRSGNWSVDEQKVLTGKDGAYQLPAQPNGTLYVAVAARGWKPQLEEVDLTPGVEPRDFSLQPGNRLRVRALDVDGKPIPGVSVVIDRWRGVYAMITGRQTELFQSEERNKTDKEGLYQWASAPDDAVRIRFSKRGFSALETELVASEETQTVTLHPHFVVSGNVVDDATGEPIDEVKLYPVTYYPLRPDDPIVQRNQVQMIDKGNYSHTESGWGGTEELMLQFESMGYRPKRIGPFNRMTGTANVDVRLEKAPPLKGRVLGAESQPIAGATVSFATKDSALLVTDWTYSRDGFSTQTDDAGRFVISATMHPTVIIATHESGYCEVAVELDEQPGDLRLQPWSRVQGRLTQGGEPVVGVSISVRPLRMISGDNPHVQDSFHCRSDRDGKFLFERLPPVPSKLSPYISVWEQCQLTSSQRIPLPLVPGKTHTVALGEQGTLIRGKVKPAGDLASSLDMNYCLNYLLKHAPGIIPPDPIARAGFDWREGWTFDLTSSQEGRGFLNTLHHHFVKFQSDGTFAIHGVSEGEYDFAISVFEPPEGCLVDPVGRRVLNFRVSAEDVRRGVLELGEVEIDVARGPQPGQPFPDFRYRSVEDDQIHTVSELKGRFVLIDVWATWCAPCVKAIPELRVCAEKFDSEKVTVLSVSLDEQINHVRAFIAEKGMDWPQALLGERDNPLVRQQLGISSVPVYCVLDPEGRLIHRSFRLSDATAALEKELDAD